MNPIVHFEIPAENVERAKKFYEKVFGWEIQKYQLPEGEYFIVRTTEVDKNMKPTSPGINGGLMQRKNPGQPFMNYISVDSIDAMCKKIKADGGTIILPKLEIGKGMGWLAAFKDTEGNIMGLHQEAKK
ncbi:MAG TPA: VOC family protein [Candidatus Nanoarchaeia archaeon]|nr:VOC family protein [Candidatus Nanoarchaeia archaeon]